MMGQLDLLKGTKLHAHLRMVSYSKESLGITIPGLTQKLFSHAILYYEKLKFLSLLNRKNFLQIGKAHIELLK